MDKKILVIHRSEVVRKGIYTTLKNHFNCEFIQLQSSKELDKIKNLKGKHILSFIEPTSHQWSDLNFLKKNNKFEAVCVCNQQNPNPNEGFKACFGLNSPATELIQHVTNSFETEKSKKREPKNGDGELSDREKDVLKQVALGLSNKEIADKLFISVHTVISHRKNITEKLGIKSISGLTVYAILNKLIDTENINPEELI